jgi:transposase
MNKKNFVGIDVSKHTLDVAFVVRNVDCLSNPTWKQFENSGVGIKQIEKWLIQMNVLLNEQTIFVMENTGTYHRLLLQSCMSKGIDVCIENAAQIKWSMGIARGKNDKADSRRLALYAARNADKLKPATARHQNVLQLKDLLSMRTNMIVHLRALCTAVNELKRISDKAFFKITNKISTDAIKGLQKSIKQTELQIKIIIQKNEKIKTLHKLLLTVPGIGHITALHIICSTNVFTMCSSGKQLASYCGVVPFSYQSGTSIKGKHKVHKMANKELKRLLHMCALSAIQHYEEFKTYFERKKKEGKHVMSVLNAIKNKLVLRVFSVVKNNKPYVDKYFTAA